MQKLKLSNKQFYYFLFAFYNILIITQVLLRKRLRQDVITSVEGLSQSSRQAGQFRLYQNNINSFLVLPSMKTDLEIVYTQTFKHAF